VTLVTVETLIPVIGDTHRAHTFAEHYAHAHTTSQWHYGR
jgi:hypothetical protein